MKVLILLVSSLVILSGNVHAMSCQGHQGAYDFFIKNTGRGHLDVQWKKRGESAASYHASYTVLKKNYQIQSDVILKHSGGSVPGDAKDFQYLGLTTKNGEMMVEGAKKVATVIYSDEPPAGLEQITFETFLDCHGNPEDLASVLGTKKRPAREFTEALPKLIDSRSVAQIDD